MKRLSVLMGILCFVLAVSLTAQDATKKQLGGTKKQLTEKKADNKAKAQEAPALQGTVISFNDYVMKGNATLTKEEAMKYVENGEALAFLAGDKVFFVYDKKGVIQSQKLAELAGKPVAIAGEEQTKYGVMILIAKSIKPVE